MAPPGEAHPHPALLGTYTTVLRVGGKRDHVVRHDSRPSQYRYWIGRRLCSSVSLYQDSLSRVATASGIQDTGLLVFQTSYASILTLTPLFLLTYVPLPGVLPAFFVSGLSPQFAAQQRERALVVLRYYPYGMYLCISLVSRPSLLYSCCCSLSFLIVPCRTRGSCEITELRCIFVTFGALIYGFESCLQVMPLSVIVVDNQKKMYFFCQ